MRVIPLQAIPNQNTTFVLDDNQWDLTLKTTNGVTSVTLVRNSEVIVSNMRAVAGMRIIPSEYEEAGNFAFSTIAGQLPEYTLFGVSQYLIYYDAEELADIRTETPPPITADWFDPDGALPLRFSPQGYVLA